MYQYVLFLLPLNYKIESNSQLKADGQTRRAYCFCYR